MDSKRCLKCLWNVGGICCGSDKHAPTKNVKSEDCLHLQIIGVIPNKEEKRNHK